VALPVTFLSDYGYDDEFAGVCRAVISRIAPDAALVDITHGIERHDVRGGAVVLANALPFCAPGVHLAIVDPGVGTKRRPLALRVERENRVLVGPDNGLLTLAAERLGGVVEAVDLAASPLRLEPVSATFHGRDIFAPAAASLANGVALGGAGEAVDPALLTRLRLPTPSVEEDRIVAHVLHIDRFGNVLLDVGHEQAARGPLRVGEQASVVVPSGSFEATVAVTFADVEEGDLVVYEDATRTLALAINRGNAAQWLGLATDVEVVLRSS
jgi:S-adenosylmethionine hydrolase